jgi:hypothetical protein
VHIYVNDSWDPFVLPKGLLCEASPYFKNCLIGDFKEAKTRRIEFSDVSFETFSYFVAWLTSDVIVCVKEPDEVLSNREMAAFVEVAIFADRIQCKGLFYRAIVTMGDGKIWFGNLELVAQAFQMTTGNHPLRRYMALHVACAMYRQEMRIADLNELDSNIRGEVLQHVTEQDVKLKNCDAKEPIDFDLEEYQLDKV